MKQLEQLEKRLQQLRNKQAIYGYNVDPSVPIEIEELGIIIDLLRSIVIHSDNLQSLRRRAGIRVTAAPVHLAEQIEHENAAIAQLVWQCKQRGFTVDTEDFAIDLVSDKQTRILEALHAQNKAIAEVIIFCNLNQEDTGSLHLNQASRELSRACQIVDELLEG